MIIDWMPWVMGCTVVMVGTASKAVYENATAWLAVKLDGLVTPPISKSAVPVDSNDSTICTENGVSMVTWYENSSAD
jgi:hypothetical protein